MNGTPAKSDKVATGGNDRDCAMSDPYLARLFFHNRHLYFFNGARHCAACVGFNGNASDLVNNLHTAYNAPEDRVLTV